MLNLGQALAEGTDAQLHHGVVVRDPRLLGAMLDVLQVAHEHEVPGLVPAGVQGVMEIWQRMVHMRFRSVWS